MKDFILQSNKYNDTYTVIDNSHREKSEKDLDFFNFKPIDIEKFNVLLETVISKNRDKSKRLLDLVETSREKTKSFICKLVDQLYDFVLQKVDTYNIYAIFDMLIRDFQDKMNIFEMDSNRFSIIALKKSILRLFAFDNCHFFLNFIDKKKVNKILLRASNLFQKILNEEHWFEIEFRTFKRQFDQLTYTKEEICQFMELDLCKSLVFERKSVSTKAHFISDFECFRSQIKKSFTKENKKQDCTDFKFVDSICKLINEPYVKSDQKGKRNRRKTMRPGQSRSNFQKVLSNYNPYERFFFMNKKKNLLFFQRNKCGNQSFPTETSLDLLDSNNFPNKKILCNIRVEGEILELKHSQNDKFLGIKTKTNGCMFYKVFFDNAQIRVKKLKGNSLENVKSFVFFTTNLENQKVICLNEQRQLFIYDFIKDLTEHVCPNLKVNIIHSLDSQNILLTTSDRKIGSLSLSTAIINNMISIGLDQFKYTDDFLCGKLELSLFNI